jgi:sugar/nucleoside kinase (ribokinase family)
MRDDAMLRLKEAAATRGEIAISGATMTDRRLDVLAIGNAIVDVIADADDQFLAGEGMHKGAMRLIDEAEATRLYERMGPARELSGGSAANTVAGLAALGLKSGFIGQLGDDQLGEIFQHDIRSLGVEFDTPPRRDVGATARCLIIVTPDAQRTMNTFLGAAQRLGPEAVDAAQVADAGILYLEGYLWDPEEPRQAMYKAMDAAKQAGTKIAFTLSDSFVVDRHRADLMRLLDEGRIDILFANEAEIVQLAGSDSFEAAVETVSAMVPTLIATRSEKGAVARRGSATASVAAEPIRALVDTTGAGDLFAAGFLAGEARGLALQESLRLGAICAAEVVQHYGARPEADLRALAGELVG